jgi:hypothetical protein
VTSKRRAQTARNPAKAGLRSEGWAETLSHAAIGSTRPRVERVTSMSADESTRFGFGRMTMLNRRPLTAPSSASNLRPPLSNETVASRNSPLFGNATAASSRCFQSSFSGYRSSVIDFSK